jgi:hypothetical protein
VRLGLQEKYPLVDLLGPKAETRNNRLQYNSGEQSEGHGIVHGSEVLVMIFTHVNAGYSKKIL